MEKEVTKNILNYLYKLEFFSPYEPVGNIIYDSKNKQFFSPNIFANYSNKSKEKSAIFSFYVGNFNYQNAIDHITKIAKIENEYKEKGKTETTIIGFKVDEEGMFLNQTFSICNFVYAINEILKEEKIDIELKEEKMEIISRKITELSKINEFDLWNPRPYLDKLMDAIKIVFPCIAKEINYDLKILVEYVSKKNVEEFDSPAILSSFYLTDIAKAKENISDKIVNYLSLEPKEQIEIDKNIEEIDKIIDPENAPLAKWPWKYKPCLMQQVAINLSINDKRNIFSVNGPPGSGKTTLVKEIIAALITRRAEIISNYKTPDEAFTIEELVMPQEYVKKYYKLDPKISEFGILVASNNNNAVENISLELPKASKVKTDKALTDLFDIDKKEEIYFTSLAQNLISEDCWGLISVPLGNGKNIKNFLDKIWFNQELKTLRNFLEEAPNDFEKAKNNFKKKLEEVKKYRARLISARKDVKQLEKIAADIKELESELKEKERELNSLKKQLEELYSHIDKLTNQNNDYQNLIIEINKKLPFFIKLFSFLFKKNLMLKKKRKLLEKITNNNLEIINDKEEEIEMLEKIKETEKTVKSLKTKIENVKEEKKKLEKRIKNYKEKEKIVIVDKNYYKDITNNKESQESSPWSSPEYDKLREELFYEVLQLHKSFVLNSKGFKANIQIMINALKGTLENDNHKICYKNALNTLFLLTPVISTSLASVSRFLKHIEQDEIGYVIIDEAGQATPASTIGVINRAKKSIILGDPFQVEPVSTIPRALYHILDKDLLVPNMYHSETLSAQILADTINKYGGKRGENNDIWIGSPLLLHRRCINPMFNIANEIAYDNKMFYCTDDDSSEIPLSLEKSCWIDIKGSEIGNKNHYVKEQGKKVIELLNNAIKVSNNKLPELFIISPFKTVAREMKKELERVMPRLVHEDHNKIMEWIENNCGTIHTFQGKETNEVIIILGCDESSKNAAAWAGQKPNILNVAVTRAKYKVAIIGDANIWSKIDCFSVAYKALK